MLTGLFILQISFISGLPGALQYINIAILSLVFMLGLKSYRLALAWALGIGIYNSLYSFLPFGTIILSYLLAVVITNFLLKNIITNRSLYSFVLLTICASLVWDLLMNVFIVISQFISARQFNMVFNTEFLKNSLSGLVLNILLVIIIYYFINFISARFKPVFLIKRK